MGLVSQVRQVNFAFLNGSDQVLMLPGTFPPDSKALEWLCSTSEQLQEAFLKFQNGFCRFFLCGSACAAVDIISVSSCSPPRRAPGRTALDSFQKDRTWSLHVCLVQKVNTYIYIVKDR